MSESDIKSPKERIFEAAVQLFAQKGYSSVGVREIAQTADVNISMISYYYQGKIGILKVMAERFFKQYFQLAKECSEREQTLERQINLFIREMVKFFKSNVSLVRVVFTESQISAPIIADIKFREVKHHKELGRKLLFCLNENVDGCNGCENQNNHGIDKYMVVVYPALLNMLYSHFMMKPTLKQIYPDVEFNDEFYDHYTETLSTLFYKGFSGVREKIAAKK